MPRPKKDPEIRRNEFINAAQKLFFSKGFKAVSIQDILNAVGDRSVSPSVFYYYFDSKETLYQAVMESYCDEYIMLMERCFSDNDIPVEERFLNAMRVMTETMTESLGRVDDSETINNRLFTLDLRDRTTRRVGRLMAETLQQYPMPGKNAEQKKRMSMYITGGISEIVNHMMLDSDTSEDEMKRIMKDIMQFSADTIGVPQAVLRRLTRRNKDGRNS